MWGLSPLPVLLWRCPLEKALWSLAWWLPSASERKPACCCRNFNVSKRYDVSRCLRCFWKKKLRTSWMVWSSVWCINTSLRQSLALPFYSTLAFQWFVKAWSAHAMARSSPFSFKTSKTAVRRMDGLCAFSKSNTNLGRLPCSLRSASPSELFQISSEDGMRISMSLESESLPLHVLCLWKNVRVWGCKTKIRQHLVFQGIALWTLQKTYKFHRPCVSSPQVQFCKMPCSSKQWSILRMGETTFFLRQRR